MTATNPVKDLIPLGVIAIALICSTATGGPNNGPNDFTVRATGREVEGIRLELSSRRREIALGQPITIGICVTNVSTNTIVVPTSNFRSYAFCVTGGDGKKAPLTEYGKQILQSIHASAASADLHSGQSYTMSPVPLGACFAMTNPGAYTITASVSVRRKDGDREGILVPSAPLTIIVQGPPQKAPKKDPKFQTRPNRKSEIRNKSKIQRTKGGEFPGILGDKC